MGTNISTLRARIVPMFLAWYFGAALGGLVAALTRADRDVVPTLVSDGSFWFSMLVVYPVFGLAWGLLRPATASLLVLAIVGGFAFARHRLWVGILVGGSATTIIGYLVFAAWSSSR